MKRFSLLKFITALAFIGFYTVGKSQTIFTLSYFHNYLGRFDVADSGQSYTEKPIQGLGTSDHIIAIDFRPATGILYGISSPNPVGYEHISSLQLYTIDTSTAIASPVGNVSPIDTIEYYFGFDFDPKTDMIEVVTHCKNGYNPGDIKSYTIDPDNGQLINRRVSSRLNSDSLNNFNKTVFDCIHLSHENDDPSTTIAFEVTRFDDPLAKADDPTLSSINDSIIETVGRFYPVEGSWDTLNCFDTHFNPATNYNMGYFCLVSANTNNGFLYTYNFENNTYVKIFNFNSSNVNDPSDIAVVPGFYGTSIADKEKFNYKITQRPENIILIENCERFSLKIINLAGQQVYHQSISSNREIVNCSDLTKGIYLAIIEGVESSFSQKIHIH